MDMDSVVTGLAAPLLRYCRGRTGSLSLAEDVAQESLRILVERWRRVGPPEDPHAFAYAVARRRAGRVWAREALLRPLDLLRERPSPTPDPAETAERRSELAAAAAALQRLPGRDREVLMLTLLGDLTLRQASQVLGISYSAAKMRLLRARRRLGAAMEICHAPA